MAAFGTKKPGADLGVELTFPGVFSRAYKLKKLGERYAPSAIAPVKQEYVGHDFQAMEHQRRREEAHKMVMAGVHATREARRRAFSSHCGYYGLPEPVLTQRVRGSNFGVGNGGGMGYPSPFAMSGAGLEGGVIASREGRVWVRDALKRRKAQLDAIDANELEAPTIRPQYEPGAEAGFSELAMIEILTYLDQLTIQLETKSLTLSSDTIRRFITLLVKFAVVADRREMEEVLIRVLGLIVVSDNLATPQDGEAAQNEAAQIQFGEIFSILFERVANYLKGMFKGIDLQPNDRKTLSKALLKDAQIARASEGVRKVWENLIPARALPTYRPHGGDDDMPGDDDEGGDEATLASAGQTRYSGRAAESMFSREPISAELSGGPRTYVSRDVLHQPDIRDRFGRQGQAGEARAMRHYADEEEGPGEQAVEDERAMMGTLVPPEMAVYERLRRDTSERLRREEMGEEEEKEEEEEEEDVTPTAPFASAASTGPANLGYWSKWTSQEFAVPSNAAVFEKNAATSRDFERWMSGFIGRAAVPQLTAILNPLLSAQGKKGTASTDQNYIKRRISDIYYSGINK